MRLLIGLVIVVAVAAAIIIVSFVALVVALLLWPGRKGRLRTTRQFEIPGHSVEQAWDLLAGRLEYERFTVDCAARPHVLRASRASTPHHDAPDELPVFSNATKPLGVEAHLAPAGGGGSAGAAVTMSMWVNDFVLQDSGEGRQVDLMLDRVINAELDREPPPVLPTMPTPGPIGLAFALGALAAAAVPFVWPVAFLGRWSMAYAFGVGLVALLAWSFATDTRKQVRSRPKELTGAWVAYVTYAVAAAAIAGAAVFAVEDLVRRIAALFG